LNINSAVRSPEHGEELLLQRAANVQPYTLRGYAYSGGGREVTRVELSCDDGISWQLASLTHPWKPTRYGRWWCWVLWELTIDARAMLLSPTLRVRAWDASNNTQPRDITWNVMGMGNNCHFAVHVQQAVAADGSVRLRFEHPTEPGALKGGWMGNAAGGWSPPSAGAAAAAVPLMPTAPPPPPPPTPASSSAAVALERHASAARSFTMEEVSRHCTEADCWIVVAGKVYDTTACAPPARCALGAAC